MSSQLGSGLSSAEGARGADVRAGVGAEGSVVVAAVKPPSRLVRAKRVLFGDPRSLTDRSLFHKVTLIALLAWVGLGADGLSSSAYGPEEAFRTLGDHRGLAVFLAGMTALTVFLISAAYSRIIEAFPHGGGGYVVASKVLGEKVGLVSGCALLVDYVLTITISIAAAGDAVFSFVPQGFAGWKLPAEAAAILALTTMNIRGVRESVLALAPVFFVFVITHLVLIVGGILSHASDLPRVGAEVMGEMREGTAVMGVGGMLLLLIRAFSMGGGTYTGIEAVSNGVPMMREPKVRTARRTMVLMSVSLAFTAAGLLLCYLLWDIVPVEGKTMNTVLAEKFAGPSWFGRAFAMVTVVSEGALLVVAAQAGFADGPRVLSNMAMDSWAPRRFAALSERLTTQNGIVLMGACGLLALWYTHGNVQHIVVMYSINVFLTFSLSLLAMVVLTSRGKEALKKKVGRLTLFGAGLALCLTILAFTAVEKFHLGGWVTLAVTSALVAVCMLVRRHYRQVSAELSKAFEGLERMPPASGKDPGEPDKTQPTAVVLTGAYDGFGVHTTLNVFRAFPGHFKGIVFVSVGVIDSGGFKGEGSIEELGERTEETARRYVDLARRLGVAATSRTAVGTDAVDEAERLCAAIGEEFPRATFFAGKVIFRKESWLSGLLHNQTAYAIQRRLQWAGRNVVVLPARVF